VGCHAAIAEFAYNVNRKTQNIGARRLNSIIEKVCEELSYSASDRPGERHVINGRNVKDRLTKIAAEDDRSKYLL
jgi:ATP-dependent HslUV protease ATP-binding subunit HslU